MVMEIINAYFDHAAEASVIGAALQDERCMKLAVRINPDEFHDLRNQTLLLAIIALEKAGKGVDLVTMYDYLRTQGKLEAAGGDMYLTDCVTQNPYTANIQTHIAIVHEKAHNDALTEKRGNLLITRGLRVSSARLGTAGQLDVVEFHRSKTGAHLHGWEGAWTPYPVEYKKGKPKDGPADILQLCAEAICLEEMLGVSIPAGALFYGEPRRRTDARHAEFTAQGMRLVRIARGDEPMRPSQTDKSVKMKDSVKPSLAAGGN